MSIQAHRLGKPVASCRSSGRGSRELASSSSYRVPDTDAGLTPAVHALPPWCTILGGNEAEFKGEITSSPPSIALLSILCFIFKVQQI